MAFIYLHYVINLCISKQNSVFTVTVSNRFAIELFGDALRVIYARFNKPGHKKIYCKFGNFRENFIFANSFKKYIRDVKNSRLGHDLAVSTNDISRGFCFLDTSHMRSFAKIKPSRNFQNLKYIKF